MRGPVVLLLVLALCILSVPLTAQVGLAASSPAVGLRQYLATPEAAQGDGQHHLGLELSPDAYYPPTPTAPALETGEPLGAAADLSGQLPPVGNQGSQGSCVAWATSYYYKSWSEKQEHGWSLSDTTHQFSPSFVYNQINGGHDGGSSFWSAFALLQNTGDIDIAEFPYYQNNYTNQPSAMQTQEAKPYRIPSTWTNFWTRGNNGPFNPPNDITNAKAWLQSGQILVMAIPVYNDFPNYGGNPRSTYYDYNGSAGLAGGHGVCIVGYDDNINPGGADADHRGGFKMVNSWGGSWNGNGYVYLSYDFIKRYTWEAWKMGDNGPDTPAIQSLSTSSGNVGSTVEINGNNFGGLRRQARVTFNGSPAAQMTWTSQKVTATVPAGASSGPLVVSDWEGTASNSMQFTVAGTGGSYTVNASVSGGHGNVAPASQVVAPGGTASINMTADSGYSVNTNTDNGQTAQVANPYLIKDVTANHSIVVTFKSPAPANQTVNAWVTGGHGSVSPATQSIPYGGSATISISPEVGYQISTIADNGLQAAIANPYLINNVITTHNVEVAFTATAPSDTYNVTASVSGGHGTVSPASQTVPSGSDAAITILPYTGYQVSSITDNGQQVEVLNPYVIGNVTGDHTVVVTFSGSEGSTVYLAEGSTDHGFNTYITIQNPNARQTSAVVTYMPAGRPTTSEAVSLPANSQTTLTNDHLQAVMGGPRDFSTKVESGEPGMAIAADRTMAWNGGQRGQSGQEGHASMGAGAPSTSWYLPEGSSKWGFESWLLVQNPNNNVANCAVTYMIEGQGPRTVRHQVPPNSRTSFSMGNDIGPRDASMQVSSDLPIVAERSIYRNDRREGSCSIGATAPAQDFYLAEGTTSWGFTTYVLVQNPQSTENTISLTYMTPSGPVRQAPFTMPPYSRKTVRVNDAINGTDFSTLVHGSRPMVAERSMYWNSGSGEACHDSIGINAPHMTFFLPDGQTSGGRETWTLVQNPNNVPVTVEITYMTQSGKDNVTRTEVVPPNARRSFGMAQHSGVNGRAAVMVSSQTQDKKIVVERSMYWDNRGAGTDTVESFED